MADWTWITPGGDILLETPKASQINDNPNLSRLKDPIEVNTANGARDAILVLPKVNHHLSRSNPELPSG